MKNINTISSKEAEKFKDYLSVLIVVATDIEKEEVIQSMEPIPEENGILKQIGTNCTYYLGVLGKHLVVLVKTEMGSGGPRGSILTTNTAILEWNPSAVVMLGIAFGINPDKQNIGDVLISNIVIPYELKKESKEGVFYRSEQPRASLELITRFEEVDGWEYKLPYGKKAKKKKGKILSGEVLIDNKEYLNRLLNDHPEVIGGEMEGAGIYAAATNQKKEWIVIKAICDFADGNKSKNKKKNQKIAIKSTVNLAMHVFSDNHAFEALGYTTTERYLELKKKGKPKKLTKKKITKELTIIPRRPLSDIVGRKGYLKKIKDLLAQKNNLVINGLGGIGKTTLVQVFVDVYYSKFKHIVWIDCSKGGVITSISTNWELMQNLEIDVKDIKEKSKMLVGKLGDENNLFHSFLFREVMRKLMLIESKPSLLIIDNVDSSIESHIQSLQMKPSWKLLLTSREKIERFSKINLDELTQLEGVELFFKYCSSIKDIEAITELLKSVDYHTLLIEVLAKTAQRRSLNVEELKNAFNNNLILKIKTAHSNLEKIESITSYLCSIFDFDELSEIEKWLLIQLTCLPSNFYDRELLIEIIKPQFRYREEYFIETLEELSDKGWLEKIENEKRISFKIHRIIIEVVIRSRKISQNDIITLIKSISEKLKINHSVEDPMRKIQWLDFGKLIISKFEAIDSLEIAELNTNVAGMHQYLSDYTFAIKLFENVIEYYEMNVKNNYYLITDSYNHLISVYLDSGDYPKAGLHLEQILIFNNENLNEENEFVVSTFAHYGRYLHLTGNLIEAEVYLKKALELDILKRGKTHPITRTRYSDYALILDDLSQHEDAREIQKNLVNALEEEYGVNHPNTVLAQANYATTIANLGMREDALEILIEVVEYYKDKYGDSPKTALQYGNLGYVHQLVGNDEKAYLLFKKALNINERFLDELHLYVIADYVRIGQVLNKLEFWEKAEEHIQKAISKIILSFDETHWYLIICYNELAISKMGKNENENAEKFFEQSLKLAKKQNKDSFLASGLVSLSTLYERTNRLDEAINLLLEAINLYEKIYKEEHPKIQEAKKKLDDLKFKK